MRHVWKTLRPGQKGTRKLVSKYGARLICVRYRVDTAARKRWKTVELVEDESSWSPSRSSTRRPIPPSALVSVHLEPWETALRARLKEAGVRWNPDLRLWRLRHDKALELGLRKRIQTPGPGSGR